MDFDLDSINLFIPKNQTLFQAIRGDVRLWNRTWYFAKKYKHAFPKLSATECLVKGQKMAYAECILKLAKEHHNIDLST